MRVTEALAIVVMITACSNTGRTATPTPRPSLVAMGCSGYPVLEGTEPQWLVKAGAGNNPAGLPYVIATPAIAAGFLFGFPLRAGHPTDPINKILWVVGRPRNGYPLLVTGHPAGMSAPVVTDSFPDNAGPGEIYPSGIDVPSPGCWDFTLNWAGNRAQIDLAYS